MSSSAMKFLPPKLTSYSSTLFTTTVNHRRIFFNRAYTFIHSSAIFLFLYYRFSFFIQRLTVPSFLVSLSEILLSLSWFMRQAFYWRPITREPHPEQLPTDDHLPGLDVFIFTSDPSKEPTTALMNTVLSVLALDYPPDKLHVYLSDDAGDAVTLVGMQEAWKFAHNWWLPFCRKYRIRSVSPEGYFYGDSADASCVSHVEHETIKQKYDAFKNFIESERRKQNSQVEETENNHRDHPPVIQVIQENPEEPLLVYVAREKRPSHHYHFKAGAINVLLRVSGVLSNSPYILSLDCDMNCNDPASARQAMCFHLDPKLSPSLSFVLFPQMFRGITKNCIYNAEHKEIFQVYFSGMEGFIGPVLSGTNFFIKRVSLFGPPMLTAARMEQLQHSAGNSQILIASIRDSFTPCQQTESWKTRIKECYALASCAFEDNTKWGVELGFGYFSVLEDVFTGFMLHCNGWKSVFINPTRPAFLGTPSTNLSKIFAQETRWCSGLVEIALSKFFPLIYGLQRKVNFMTCICYAWILLFPLFHSLSYWILATVPQLCLIHGVSVYPESSPPFLGVAAFIILSTTLTSIFNVLATGGSIRNSINSLRIEMIRYVTNQTHGTLEAVMTKLNLKRQSFLPTNKVDNDDMNKLYRADLLDFRVSAKFLIPLVSLVFLNFVSLSVGIARMVVSGEKMFVQLFISSYVSAFAYPIIEGVFFRHDIARVTPTVALSSAAATVIIIVLRSTALFLL